jgi:CheY-like chemotaxis protein
MGPLAGKRVLVVEDEPLIAMVLEDVIADLGGASATAATVAAATSLITVERFDAAVLDLNLNGETSRSLSAQLREHGVPFAFATGYGVAADDTGDAPIIPKPYTPEDLAQALCRLLGKNSSHGPKSSQNSVP